MGIKVENFEFSSDFLSMSEEGFKAHMKKTHGVSAKKAKELFKQLHGDGTTDAAKDTASSKSKDAGTVSVSRDKEVSEHSDKPSKEEA